LHQRETQTLQKQTNIGGLHDNDNNGELRFGRGNTLVVGACFVVYDRSWCCGCEIGSVVICVCRATVTNIRWFGVKIFILHISSSELVFKIETSGLLREWSIVWHGRRGLHRAAAPRFLDKIRGIGFKSDGSGTGGQS
jgi:hypothetical protein